MPSWFHSAAPFFADEVAGAAGGVVEDPEPEPGFGVGLAVGLAASRAFAMRAFSAFACRRASAAFSFSARLFEGLMVDVVVAVLGEVTGTSVETRAAEAAFAFDDRDRRPR
ncbi:hypothetical protein JCM9957A_39750 [Kineosporia succinea]